MEDVEDARLKAEIDQIVKNIDTTMKKIEKVAPLQKETVEKSEVDTGADT
ncbi:MAG: hypothetical protein PVI06_21470 [Desulfobacterales bacterium]|jgi:hypothetical protein